MKTFQTSNKFIELDYSKLKDLTELEAGQGAGKTTSLSSLIDKDVLLVSSSNNLLKQIQLRMPEMKWQMHIKASGHTHKGEDLQEYLEAKHCLCNLQSIHLWEDSNRQSEVLVIEEADITLKDMYLYRTNHVPTIKNMTQLIWRMKDTPSVICIGAHSTGYLNLFNQRKLQRKHTFHQNKYKDLEGKRLGLCDNGNQLKSIIEKQLELRVSNRNKHGGVFMPTEYSNKIGQMIKGWENRFPGLKTKIVKADKKLTEKELELLADEHKEQEWDLLICSPSLRDGFHIMGGFDLVAGDYGGSAQDILTADEIINALLRVRTCTHFALHCKDTKSLEGDLKSKEILEKVGMDFTKIPKHLRTTNEDTGKLEIINAEEEIGYNFWTEHRKENTLGRKKSIPEKWNDRGGVTYFPDYISKTIPKYSRTNKMISVIDAKPYNSKDWGRRNDEYRTIHSEILNLYGEVTEDTYTAWDNGNYKKNEERNKRLFKTKIKDGLKDDEVDVDLWTEQFIRKIGDYIVAVDDAGEVYQIHTEAFLGWAIWIELKQNKDKWNKLCSNIGLKDCEIRDIHLSTESDKCLEWLTTLLRKYNYKVDCVDAKPQKAKTLTRQLAEPQYRPYLKQWRAEGNKSQPLERYFWAKLSSREETLKGLTKEAKNFLDCYSHIVISKQNLSQSNYHS